ncbi:MAG: protein translocase subunit SecF [Thermoleophilia bacterium]|jgi:SecD/SecF fusion protein
MRTFHFMHHKWWFLGFLTLVTIVAIAIVFIVGLDFGIDFKGGVRMQVGLEKPATVDDVRTLVSDIGIQDPVVQSVADTSGAQGFMITAEEMTEAQSKKVVAQLDETYVVKAGSTGTETVGASFGEETTNRALIAILIAVVVILGYLTLRFEIKFALPGIVALIHDLALTLGIYAATGRLVTYATVAAILTILGYSVHDTIVIFDRMRENTLLMKRETYGDMVDLSIRQTMVRSINTSVALVLPLVAILIFGGPTLTDFAFALTIGVITGTYSSFFVAAPLITIWKEREPRYRKRLLAAGAEAQLALDATDGGTMVADSSAVRSTTVGGSKASSSSGQKPVQKRPAKATSKKTRNSKRPVAKNKKRTSQ